ncbi:MAG: hypothetical protein IJU26_03850 [Synergistaceae bacterium]|nr:hypothetical protein [Synergistaceae bacterium]
MNTENMLMNLRAFLLKKSGGEDFSDTEFRRTIDVTQTIQDEDTGTEQQITRKAIKLITSATGSRKKHITLVPMRSLAVEEYTFPFSNTTKIREALRLQAMPYSAAGELELFPVTLARTGREASGLVWYASPSELEIPGIPGDSGTGKIWPAPLAFVSGLESYNGSGVTMWIDEENICSILWQENKPVLYRWRSSSGAGSEEKELAWYDAYCSAKELDRGGNFVVNAADSDDDDEAGEEFAQVVAQSVKICPWIDRVNLSRRALEGARDLERSVRLLTRVALWLLLLGGAALGGSFLRWQQLTAQIQELRTRTENYYRQTFEPQRTGRIANPVAFARDKIAELSGTGTTGHPIEEVMADLGEIFGNEQHKGVTLDVIRYNAEGFDCTGTAPDMSTVLNFRKAWEDRDNKAQVDNTQFVAGIGYRFDLRVRWN